MSQHPRQTFIYSPTFRWNGDLLEQEVQIIQHYPDRDRDVGIFREWHPAQIDGKAITRSVSPKPVPHDNPLGKPKSKGMPDTLKELVAQGFPKTGRHLIEFDGGTSCNNPRQGFGKGYGSFQIDNGSIHRVEFGMGHSSNSAEIRTLVAALQQLAKEVGNPEEHSVLVRGDSQIALKWVKCPLTPKEKTSEGFREAITLLRTEVTKFRGVKTEWRRRDYSVRLFGH
jgi:ribonuclease HI